MLEKSQWISTGSLKRWYSAYDPQWGRYLGIPIYDAKAEELVVIGQTNGAASVVINSIIKRGPANSTNPCFLTKDPAIKFKPTLLIGVYPKENFESYINLAEQRQSQSDITNNPITFNVEIDIVCSFRGLRRNQALNE